MNQSLLLYLELTNSARLAVQQVDELFTWELEIEIEVFILDQQAYHQLNHTPSPYLLLLLFW